MIDVPAVVREKAMALGAGARLDELPALVRALEGEWAGDPRDRARHLGSRTGLDAEAILEWGVVERVSTGLLGVQIGLEPVGTEMLRTADAVAAVQWRRT